MIANTNGSTCVESLADVFRCFICLEKVRDARLCPHCSKLCCYPCIRRWLIDQHQQCPHCRTTLHLNDLVNCRWAEDVTSQINHLQINEKQEEKDQCQTHKEKLTVFCSTCTNCICHQCALFNDKHTNHAFLPLDDVYKSKLSIVNDHLKQLKQRHIEYICLIQDIEKNIEKIKMTHSERIREIENSIYSIHCKLTDEFQSKLDTLNAQYTKYSYESDFLERTLHYIENRLSTKGKAELITNQEDLLKSIQQICNKPLINFDPISADFLSELLPAYKTCTFILMNFSQLQEKFEPVYSSSLDFDGMSWRLKVYPNGNESVRGEYLSVFLELMNGRNVSSKYQYRVEMIYQLEFDPVKNITREFTSDFELGECWGYNKFFPLESLRNEGFVFNDKLILHFSVRSLTYEQKSSDQQWHIKQLQNQNQQLNIEIQNLHEQIRSINEN